MKKFVKKLKGWKTVAINLVAAIVPILELSEWVYIVPSGYFPHYVVAVAVLNLWLRWVTDTKIGASK